MTDTSLVFTAPPESAAPAPASPVAGPPPRASHTAELIASHKAMESWRDAGYDLTAAAGEALDNSIEAKASIIRVATTPSKVQGAKQIDEVAFADDGIGIPPEILADILTLGYSSRYNQRDGLGRFGVGLKLATLSVGRRLDVYSRHVASGGQIWHAYLDLDQIGDGTQTEIVATPVDDWPRHQAQLMRDRDGKEYESGSLIVWSKIDRLSSGGKFNTNLASRFTELQNFLARAYRKFLDTSLMIELNGRSITLHDPTFQLHNPRVDEKLGSDIRSEIVETGKINIDKWQVTVTVTLLPAVMRQQVGDGGKALARDLHVPENEGRISFLRQGREINYDQVAKMLPHGVQDIDRWIGIEVEFPAALDEYFQVRHVKRGVVPVDLLRQELKEWLDKPVLAARKQIRELYAATATANARATEQHDAAQSAAAKVEQTSAKGKAGATLSAGDEDARIEDVADQISGGDEAVRESKGTQLREAVSKLPMTIVDSTWPGKELIDITHLNGKAIIKVNHGHPFIKQIYDPARDLAQQTVGEVDAAEALRLARRVEVAIDVLLMAYAKAENMHREPDLAYSDLRTYWGQFAAAYTTEALKQL